MTQTESEQIDKVLNGLVEDHIDIPSMDRDSCNAWIDDYRVAKAAISERFTAQEKQHQKDLLKARIDENRKWLDSYMETGDDITDGQLNERLYDLETDLAKLEGESA